MPFSRRHARRLGLFAVTLGLTGIVLFSRSYVSSEVQFSGTMVANNMPAAPNMHNRPIEVFRRHHKGNDGSSTTESSSESPSGSSSGPSSDAIKSFRATDPTLINERTFTDTPPKRLIFIGDIHGCSDEFNALLTAVDFQQETDQIILVGDLVAKGPDSLGVVNKAQSINAWAVRGNHDDRVLRWYEFLQGPAKGMSESDIQSLEDSGGLPYDDFKLKSGHYEIASTMPASDISYLSKFPTLITLPDTYSEWVVAHGGMEPTKAILAQDPQVVMTIRTIGPDGPSSEESAGDAWFQVWADKIGPLGGVSASASESMSESVNNNSNRKRKNKETYDSASTSSDDSGSMSSDDFAELLDDSTAEPTGDFNSFLVSSTDSSALNKIQFKKVIYGHDAGRGLQIHDVTKGLDSRCVYGGNLTAFILPGEKLINVPCKSYNSKNPSKDRRRRREFLKNRALELS